MRIAVIGSGRVGGTLGRLWAATGHEVIFGSREPTAPSVLELTQEVPGATAAFPAEAIARAAAVLLAVPAKAAADTVRSVPEWSGQVIVDATNALDDLDSSNAERIQRAAPGATVVKAFNVVGVEAMERVVREGITATMPIAGNDERAVALVFTLARDAGFEPLHVGGLAQGASLERLASVWLDWSRTLGRGFLWSVQV